MPDAVVPGASDPEARRAVTRLYEMLSKVDARGRMAFVLRHIEGCDLAEVAEALECSVATAKRVLARADDRVNAMLKRDPLLAAYARVETDCDDERDERDEVMDAAE